VKVITEKKQRSVGQIKFNLAEFAGKTEKVSKVVPLAKCADKKAKIAFNVKTSLLEEDC